ncbi:MAG: DNA/RNA nuclease SfsA [Deltaproteobacteria bacterium]|nr:DNA/RNA nuclease SfsA [Deltaproteobacteria bacterium]
MKASTLEWPKLLQGHLIRRYQRFKADVKLRNGHMVTALCPNTGSMLACSEPGRPVYLSRHNKPERKLKYTWELIDMPSSLVGVNTVVPNRLVKLSIQAGRVPGLSGFNQIRPEVKYGKNSRIDLLLENRDGRCYIEIKNCTLVEGGVARFPDAVTARGLKHLIELQNQVGAGDRAVMFYLIQRMDAEVFRPADHIDPAYGKALRTAVRKGVEILVYDVDINLKGIRLNRALPYEL